MDSVQSLEVIPGAPPAEYGGKTSLVIVATTRSGLGNPRPHGEVNASYGSFGTSNVGFNLAAGSQKVGNFFSANVMNTGRFLDPPEFHAIHDKGNEENLFDRVDYQVTTADSVKLNLGYTRSWFQTPNSYDTQYATQWPTNSAGVAIGPNGLPVGPSDQRAQIQTVNFAPSYTRVLSPSSVLTTNYFFRRDNFHYYPSKNPFADLGAPDLQQESIAQQRSLANTGLRSDITYTHGGNNVKAGVSYEQTFLNEDFQLGIVDPTLIANLGCETATGTPIPGTDCATLSPYDLTAGGSSTASTATPTSRSSPPTRRTPSPTGPWTGNFGLRFDRYNGLVVASQVEPRLALSYNIKRTGTVLRASYARTLESPFNENLVISSEGCNYAVIAALIPCTPAPNRPGFRNDFHAGFQQSSRATPFSPRTTCGSTPTTRTTSRCWAPRPSPSPSAGTTPRFRASTAASIFRRSTTSPRRSSSRPWPRASSRRRPAASAPCPRRPARGSRPSASTTTSASTRPRTRNTNWRARPIHWLQLALRFRPGGRLGSLLWHPGLQRLPAVHHAQRPAGGVSSGCRSARRLPPTRKHRPASPATASAPRPPSRFPTASARWRSSPHRCFSCPRPTPRTTTSNPARIASRNLFDLSFGEDNLLHRKTADKRALSASVTIVNLANKTALYNFLSTFSGTHYVTPRSITGELAYHF